MGFVTLNANTILKIPLKNCARRSVPTHSQNLNRHKRRAARPRFPPRKPTFFHFLPLNSPPLSLPKKQPSAALSPPLRGLWTRAAAAATCLRFRKTWNPRRSRALFLPGPRDPSALLCLTRFFSLFDSGGRGRAGGAEGSPGCGRGRARSGGKVLCVVFWNRAPVVIK